MHAAMVIVLTVIGLGCFYLWIILTEKRPWFALIFLVLGVVLEYFWANLVLR